MILPVAATHVAKSLFRGNNSKQNDDESDDDYENDDSDELSDDVEADVSISDEDVNDPISAAKKKMKETWHSLSPPKPEEEIVGNWYGVVWQGKRGEVLYIAQVVRRFLVDKDGPIDSILMRCLKPKIGSGITLEDTPKHLPPDESHFQLSNVIAGPMKVIAKG